MLDKWGLALVVEIPLEDAGTAHQEHSLFALRHAGPPSDRHDGGLEGRKRTSNGPNLWPLFTVDGHDGRALGNAISLEYDRLWTAGSDGFVHPLRAGLCARDRPPDRPELLLATSTNNPRDESRGPDQQTRPIGLDDPRQTCPSQWDRDGRQRVYLPPGPSPIPTVSPKEWKGGSIPRHTIVLPHPSRRESVSEVGQYVFVSEGYGLRKSL